MSETEDEKEKISQQKMVDDRSGSESEDDEVFLRFHPQFSKNQAKKLESQTSEMKTETFYSDKNEPNDQLKEDKFKENKFSNQEQNSPTDKLGEEKKELNDQNLNLENNIHHFALQGESVNTNVENDDARKNSELNNACDTNYLRQNLTETSDSFLEQKSIEQKTNTVQQDELENKNENNSDKNEEQNDEQFFTKHYVEPKKYDLKVKFDTNVCTKPPTEVNTILESTLQKDEDEIFNCETEEELNEKGKKLLKELEMLEKKKSEGYDIYHAYQDLQYKFQIFQERKVKIINKLKRLNSNDDCKHVDRNHNVIKQRNNIYEIPKNELNDNWGQRDKYLNEDIFQYLTSYNTYQILFVFYNCQDALSTNFFAYFHELFTKSFGLDLNVAMCSFEEDFISITDFIDKKNNFDVNSKTNYKTLKNLKDFLNDIPNMNWSQSSQKIKILQYVTSNTDSKKEIDDIINSISSDFIKHKRIYQTSFELNKNAGIQTFNDYVNKGILNTILHKRKFSWIFDQLCMLKRLDLNTVDELRLYQKDKLKIDNVDMKSECFEAELKTMRKGTFLERVTKSSLNDTVSDYLKVTFNKCKVIKNVCLQEAFGREWRMKSIYWIEKCYSEAVLLNVIDIYSTARFFSKKFGEKLSKLKPSYRKIFVSEYFWLRSKSTLSRDTELLIANKTDFAIDKAKIEECVEAQQILDAFMHFTYEFSSKSLIVFDLRTILIPSNDFMLTEPVVFSTDTTRFGPSNLGHKGIELMWGNHDCNETCCILGLRKI